MKKEQTLEDRVADLQDRLRDGIKYDEKNNQYIVVWTKRELEQARAEADELMSFFKR